MENKKGFYKDVFENCLKAKIILVNGIKFEKILEYYEDCEDPFRSGCEGIYFMYFENSTYGRVVVTRTDWIGDGLTKNPVYEVEVSCADEYTELFSKQVLMVSNLLYNIK